ncbi:MAG: GAF domain-containing sensor histidine kinase [Chloroflexi bacterium]|nr:GAF domain-containing sensor histidine kinase [Chloroflexota bacterium]
MTELTAFFQANIILIYFFYGLAHFLTGFAVALEMGRRSELPLTRALPFLALFALTHAVNEWLEMLSKLAAAIPTFVQEPGWAEIVKLSLEGISFFALFLFAVQLLSAVLPERSRRFVALPLISLGIYAAGLQLLRIINGPAPFITRMELAGVWTSYMLGLPATTFAALALLMERRALVTQQMPQFGRDLVGAALALAWYGVLDQIIVPPTTLVPSNVINKEVFLHTVGVPVEVFRILAIGLFAFFMIRVLRVFEVEYARRLDEANRARFDAQEEAARELMVMFETCRVLGSSLDMDRLLDDSLAKIVTNLQPLISGMVYLVDPLQNTLVLRAQRTRDPKLTLTEPERRYLSDGVQRAFETGEVTYNPLSDSDIATIAVPLIAKEKTVGVLCLAHQRAFSNFAVIHTLARQIAIAIENSQLYLQVQERDVLRGELLERAVAAQEEERKRIARELHDETGQMLTALAVGLGAVEQTVATDPPKAERQVGELKNVTMRAIENLRQFVSDLRPSLLDDMGLVSAVRWYMQQFSERMNVPANFEVVGTKRRLPTQVETVLFRIAQEALNNVGRHARAKHANVKLAFGADKVTLVVDDDGVGFEVNQVMGKYPVRRAWGLLGVQERVELVGGKFTIESEPGCGTKLIVEIPVKMQG